MRGIWRGEEPAGRRCGRACLRATAFAVGLGAACVLGGCVFSNTVTEVIYVQDPAYAIDYDAEPIFINSATGEYKSEQLPSLSPQTQGTNDVLESIPEWEGDLSHANVQEAKDAYREPEPSDQDDDAVRDQMEADDEGSDQDDSVEGTPLVTSGQQATSSSATAGTGRGTVSSRVADDSGQRSSQGAQSDAADKTDSSGSTEADGGKTGDSPTGGGSVDDETGAGNNPDDGKQQSDVGREPGRVFSDAGAIDELPTGVRTVAAVGDAAVVAAVLGGADGEANLVAADAQTLSGNTLAVLSGLGAQAAQVCWEDDGSWEGSADLDALFALAPDAVLVTEGEQTLSQGQVDALVEAGTHVVYVPSLSTTDKVLACVQRVGRLLELGGDGAAATCASEYREFAQGIVETCGGAEDAVYVLYVDDWVATVYTGPLSARVTGVAMAPAGNAAQPGSDYLALAGVQNVPAVKVRYRAKDGEAVVWPLAGGVREGELEGIEDVNAGLQVTGSGFDLALTRMSPNNNDFYDLGSPQYVAIVCRQGWIADAVAADRADGGLYSADLEGTSIASDGYAIEVNPHGVFASWMDGSLESVLECAWGYREFRCGGDDGGYLAERVSYLYDHFYQYDLGDGVDDVLAAAYAE